MPGNQPLWLIYGGTTAGASGIFSTAQTVGGYVAGGFTAANASFFYSLWNNTTVTGDFVNYVYVSLTRCPLVKGAAQTGSTLAIDGLPLSTAGLLLPGDWFSVGLELKRVTAPLNSDGSGNGTLQFSPPLRASPADNDPVIINQPFGRFILSSSENGWQSTPGIFAAYSLDLVEAP
jgi:hypothetical protein